MQGMNKELRNSFSEFILCTKTVDFQTLSKRMEPRLIRGNLPQGPLVVTPTPTLQSL